MDSIFGFGVNYIVGGTLVGKVLIDDFCTGANHTWENMVKEIVGDRPIKDDINFLSFVGNNRRGFSYIFSLAMNLPNEFLVRATLASIWHLVGRYFASLVCHRLVYKSRQYSSAM